jgi:recombination protein RecA
MSAATTKKTPARKKTTKKTPARKKTKRKASRKKAAKKTSAKKDEAGGKVDVVKTIRTKHGDDAIMFLGGSALKAVEVIPTGSLSLDIATGIGGLPRGRIVEVYGPESSGKTTLTLHGLAQAQKAGGLCAFVDAEHALDPSYAQALGVDIDKLMISQPDCGEQALEIVSDLVRSGAVDLVVIDSVAALVPRAELDGEMGDTHMGLQARLMSQAMRKLTGIVSKSRTTVIFINQTRHKIGVMFGSPVTTSGGNALKFYASLRLKIARTGSLKVGEDSVGIQCEVLTVKNKLAPPFRKAEFDILYGEGVSKEGEIVNMGVDLGFIDKAGAWFSYYNQRIGQGRRNAVLFLKENPDMAKDVEVMILRHFGLIPDPKKKAVSTKTPTTKDPEPTE